MKRSPSKLGLKIRGRKESMECGMFIKSGGECFKGVWECENYFIKRKQVEVESRKRRRKDGKKTFVIVVE